jgi:hypothetical protein
VTFNLSRAVVGFFCVTKTHKKRTKFRIDGSWGVNSPFIVGIHKHLPANNVVA